LLIYKKYIIQSAAKIIYFINYETEEIDKVVTKDNILTLTVDGTNLYIQNHLELLMFDMNSSQMMQVFSYKQLGLKHELPSSPTANISSPLRSSIENLTHSSKDNLKSRFPSKSLTDTAAPPLPPRSNDNFHTSASSIPYDVQISTNQKHILLQLSETHLVKNQKIIKSFTQTTKILLDEDIVYLVSNKLVKFNLKKFMKKEKILVEFEKLCCGIRLFNEYLIVCFRDEVLVLKNDKVEVAISFPFAFVNLIVVGVEDSGSAIATATGPSGKNNSGTTSAKRNGGNDVQLIIAGETDIKLHTLYSTESMKSLNGTEEFDNEIILNSSLRLLVSKSHLNSVCVDDGLFVKNLLYDVDKGVLKGGRISYPVVSDRNHHVMFRFIQFN
jgi:hypothetical protein